MTEQNSLIRIDDEFNSPLGNCPHGWIVENKCVWCGDTIVPFPVGLDYSCFFDDEIEIDEIYCPNCGTNTQSRECTSLGCDDGYFDEYDDDPINFAPGEEYSKCNECHGTGIERWCPNCGWQWCGESLSSE